MTDNKSDSLNEQSVPQKQGDPILEKAMKVKPIPHALESTPPKIIRPNPNQAETNSEDKSKK